MSTHFDMSGVANGWMQKRSFMLFGAGLLVFLSGIFVALTVLIPRLPDSAISLPNPDYWLAPARRGETLHWINGWLLYFGTSTLVLLGMVAQTLYRTNVDGTHHLGSSTKWLITGFSAFALVQISGFVRRFSQHPERPKPSLRSRR